MKNEVVCFFGVQEFRSYKEFRRYLCIQVFVSKTFFGVQEFRSYKEFRRYLCMQVFVSKTIV